MPGPPVDAVLGAVLTNSAGFDTADFDVALDPTVRLFAGPTSGVAVGHLAESSQAAGNRLALVIHVTSSSAEAVELLEAIDATVPPGLDVQLTGSGGPPGQPRRRPRLLALQVNHLGGWPGSELRLLDRHGAQHPADTLTARRRQRFVLPPRPRTILDGPPGTPPRPVVDLTPIPAVWSR